MCVIVVVCAEFVLTVLETNMCLRSRGMPESITIFSVQAVGRIYNQTNGFLYLGEYVNHNADLSIEIDRRIHNV